MKNFFEYLGLAGLVSLLGLAATWSAIVLLLKGLPFFAIYAAITAFFLDSLDGYIARKKKAESDFGGQLDTMLDFLNYSCFAALFLVLYIIPNLLGIIIGFIILTTGALRLVRLNIEGFVEEEGEKYYTGILVCFISFIAASLFLLKQLSPGIVVWIAPPLLLIFSFLQVTRLRFRKTHSYHFWASFVLILLALTIYVHIWIK